MAKNNSSGGIGFVGLLTITFIVLKLTNVIKWSWWWALSPLWISALLGLGVIVLTLTVWFIHEARIKSRKKKK